jgi:hypothetical protein
MKFSVKEWFSGSAIARGAGAALRFQSDQNNGRVRFRAQRAGQMFANQTGGKRVGQICQGDDLRKRRLVSDLRQEDRLFVYCG